MPRGGWTGWIVLVNSSKCIARKVTCLLCFGLTSLLLAACNAATPQPTSTVSPPPTSISTFTVPPTITPSSIPTRTRTPAPSRTPTVTPIPPTATATVTPTSTPWPALSPQGPYLLYESGTLEKPIYIIIGADGHGRKIIELPDGGYVWDLQKAVSPDGKWLIFYLGQAGWYSEPGIPTGISINIMHLPDGSIRPIASIQSGLTPDALSEVVKKLQSLYPQYTEIDESSFVRSLQDGLFSYAWSPNGDSFAFAGQIDGVSSDLYLFDVQTGNIRRLTDEPENIYSIEWSPDGKWILFENTIPSYDYIDAILCAIQPDQSIAKKPKALEEGFWWQGKGWISPKLYMITGQGDGGEPYYLRYVNIETGQMVTIWSDTYFSFSVDPQNSIVALSGGVRSSQPDVFWSDIGFYYITLGGTRRKITDEVLWGLVFRGGAVYRFLGYGDDEGLFGIAQDGSMTLLSDKPYIRVSFSPDHRWFVLYQDPGGVPFSEIDGMDLYSEADQFVRTIIKKGSHLVVWRPDSAGFYYSTGKELYYLTVPDGQPVLIDQCQFDSCRYNELVWLP